MRGGNCGGVNGCVGEGVCESVCGGECGAVGGGECGAVSGGECEAVCVGLSGWGGGANEAGFTSWSLWNSPPTKTVGVRLGRDMRGPERGYCRVSGLWPDLGGEGELVGLVVWDSHSSREVGVLPREARSLAKSRSLMGVLGSRGDVVFLLALLREGLRAGLGDGLGVTAISSPPSTPAKSVGSSSSMSSMPYLLPWGLTRGGLGEEDGAGGRARWRGLRGLRAE